MQIKVDYSIRAVSRKNQQPRYDLVVILKNTKAEQKVFGKNYSNIELIPAKVLEMGDYQLICNERGLGTINIAKQLSKEEILTPSFYKYKNGNKRFERYLKEGKEYWWNTSYIYHILRDLTYIGSMPNGKSKFNNNKTKRTLVNSRDEWIVVPNTHEAIISKEDFEQAQKALKGRKVTQKHFDTENIFKGLVKCSVCGKNMVLNNKTTRGVKPYYVCNEYHSFKWKEKHWVTINYSELKEIVTAKIKDYFKLFKDDKNLIETIQKRSDDTKISVNLEKEISRIEAMQDTLSNIIKKVYDDYFEGLISTEVYQGLIKQYQDEQTDLKTKHDILLIEKRNKKNYLDEYKKMKDIVNSFLDFEELTQEMVDNLIEKIEVANVGERGRKQKRIVKIKYYF